MVKLKWVEREKIDNEWYIITYEQDYNTGKIIILNKVLLTDEK